MGLACCAQDDPQETKDDPIRKQRSAERPRKPSFSEVPSASGSKSVVNVNIDNHAAYSPSPPSAITPSPEPPPQMVPGATQTIVTPQPNVHLNVDVTPSPQPSPQPPPRPSLTANELMNIIQEFKSASKDGDETLAIKLLTEHPDLDLMNVQFDNGDRPLHAAVENQNEKLVFYLLQNGASV